MRLFFGEKNGWIRKNYKNVKFNYTRIERYFICARNIKKIKNIKKK